MAEILIKSFYTIVLIAIAGVCMREVWQVWFDDSLQYGHFAATKDGGDAASTGDSFRRLIVQQQRFLYSLFKGDRARQGSTIVSNTGETFRVRPEDFHIAAVSELGDIPASLLDQLKIEAAGVNVTSLLSTLRRGVKPPNEITGSVDELKGSFYVSAQWPQAPRRDGKGTESRTFTPAALATVDAASFDLACRIFLARIAPSHPAFQNTDEDDFCAFARALAAFRSFITARDRALNEEEKKKANEFLATAQTIIDRLIAAKTTLPYAYKLGGYIDIDRLATMPTADAAKAKEILDQAEKRFTDYVTRLGASDAKAKDADVQERLVYLASRRGTVDNAQQLAQSTSVQQFVRTAGTALQSIKEPPPAPPNVPPENQLRPGASIGPATGGGAGTLCCAVKDQSGKRFLVTTTYVVGKIGEQVVSPAAIEAAKSKLVGTVGQTTMGISLVEIAGGVTPTNGAIQQLAEPALGGEVTLLGRTSKNRSGRINAVDVTMTIGSAEPGSLPSSGYILTDRISLPGDGGAPVLDNQGHLIGMLIAGSDKASVVLPLKRIFDANGLSLL